MTNLKQRLHRNPRDLSDSIIWARNILSNPDRFVILDTETTGIRKTDEVIQIAILSLKGDILLDSLVLPEKRKSIPRDASDIHGIKMKDLLGAPHFSDLVSRIREITYGKTIICYNAEFDERLIEQTIDKNDSPSFYGYFDCAMIQYSKFIGKWNERYGDYKWQKLPRAKHSAIEDCMAVLRLITIMANTELPEGNHTSTGNPGCFTICAAFLLGISNCLLFLTTPLFDLCQTNIVHAIKNF